MKLISRINLCIVFAFAILIACTGAPTSNAVQLPEALVIVIGLFVMTVVTAAFKWLGARIGQDLSTHAKQVAAALSSIIVLGINYAFALVPAAYDNFLNAAVAFLVVWLGGMGLYNFWKSTR